MPFSWAASDSPDTPLKAAYAACARIARHHENFPVASRLLPRAMRGHVAAIYAFARTADDFADEGDHSDAERECLLDDWLHRLRAAAKAESIQDSASLFAALGHTIRSCRLPLSLFEDLLSAFRQDVIKKRYETWDELVDYCRRSANPVGRLVLRVAGRESEELDRLSDAVCTALQLTNMLQDLDRDWARGRLYVPRSDLDAAGATESDLARGVVTSAWREALARFSTRTRTFFAEGRPIGDRIDGRLGLQLRLTWLGGMLVLDRVERAGFDVFRRRPSVRLTDVPALIWQAARWSAGP